MLNSDQELVVERVAVQPSREVQQPPPVLARLHRLHRLDEQRVQPLHLFPPPIVSRVHAGWRHGQCNADEPPNGRAW
jgi:hypothetical protein